MRKRIRSDTKIDYRLTLIIMLAFALLCLTGEILLLIFAKDLARTGLFSNNNVKYILLVNLPIISVMLFISVIIVIRKTVYLLEDGKLTVKSFSQKIIKEVSFSDIQNIKASPFGLFVITDQEKIYLPLALRDFPKVYDAVDEYLKNKKEEKLENSTSDIGEQK